VPISPSGLDCPEYEHDSGRRVALVLNSGDRIRVCLCGCSHQKSGTRHPNAPNCHFQLEQGKQTLDERGKSTVHLRIVGASCKPQSTNRSCSSVFVVSMEVRLGHEYTNSTRIVRPSSCCPVESGVLDSPIKEQVVEDNSRIEHRERRCIKVTRLGQSARIVECSTMPALRSHNCRCELERATCEQASRL